MSVDRVIELMLQFGSFLIALLTLLILVIKMTKK